jgi:protein transport protein HofQ
VPWLQALRSVIDSAGLALTQQGSVLYVHTQAWQKAQQLQLEAESKASAESPLQGHSVTCIMRMQKIWRKRAKNC